MKVKVISLPYIFPGFVCFVLYYAKTSGERLQDHWSSGYIYVSFVCRTEKELGSMEEAHDAIIWDLAWHPLGHILSSASNDHST